MLFKNTITELIVYNLTYIVKNILKVKNPESVDDSYIFSLNADSVAHINGYKKIVEGCTINA